MVYTVQSQGIRISPEGRSAKQAENDRRVDAIRAKEGGHRAEPNTKSDKKDSIEFSDAALKLADQASNGSSKVARSETLSPQRLNTITSRMADGFYDSEAVRNEIARRLLPDL